MTDKEVLLLRRKLDLLLRTGKLLMESAADTNRIERNMKRVAAFMGIPEEKLHIDIRWTMIMVNVSDERNSFSKFQKCEKHGINMTTISQVSKLSWRAIEQDYSLDKYEEELEKIVRQPRNYTPYIVAIGAGFACGGFCKLFGGDWIAFLLTSICTFIGFRVRARCVEAGLNERLTEHTEVKAVDIAVVRIPRMSNYTDFNVFELIPGVSLRYVDKVQDLKNPDMIIIPGTKNTIGDLKWLRQSGFEAEILKHAHKGTVIFGVCGGYQMLGKNLSDPYGVEEGGDTAGIGLLDVETIFAEKKRTIRVEGHFGNVQGVFANLSGKDFYGYEIHSGVTEFDKDNALTQMQPIYEEGGVMPEGSQHIEGQLNVYGTYVHGIFDSEGVAAAVVEALLAKKGMSSDDIKVINFDEYKKQQYDILADNIRKNIDMKKVYEILEAGI